MPYKQDKNALADVQLVISAMHEGLKAAIDQMLSASWQRCRWHFMYHLLAHVPKASQSLVGTLIRQVFVQPDAKSAQTALVASGRSTPPAFPQGGGTDGRAEADVLAHLSFPAPSG